MAEKLKLLNSDELEKSFTDILYLTNRGSIRAEIQELLSKRKLTCHILPIEKFSQMRNRLDSVGTVIIDSKDADRSPQMVRIVEILETERIGVIILADEHKASFDGTKLLSSSNDDSGDNIYEAVSIDELWIRLCANLAYRKKSSQIAAKSAVLPKCIQPIYKNKLAEQLNMTKLLAENLTEQLRLAGLVQQDFLPSRLPNTNKLQWATTFLPAEWVSGDIYDITRLDEDHIGFYIADVVGHGMPAALLTIFLKQALVMRETVGNSYHIFSPAEAVTNLNIRMAAQKLSGYQFATCCYCLLNTKTLKLTYARAGHPYPILIRKSQKPLQLEVRGSLLGVFEQAEFFQQTVQLQPGDKLLLYSDGADPIMGNFRDSAGFCFTSEFLKTTNLHIVDMLDSLKIQLQAKEIRESEIDDITLLGLEVL